MQGANGSRLILPLQPVTVPLMRVLPNGQRIAIDFPAHADPREFSEPRDIKVDELLVNELLVGLSQTQATVAALSGQLACAMVVIDALAAGGTFTDARVRDALAHLQGFAAQCTIVPVAPSALDAIDPTSAPS